MAIYQQYVVKYTNAATMENDIKAISYTMLWGKNNAFYYYNQ